MKELPERIHDDTNGLDYVLVGDYYIPALRLTEESRPIGHWGRRRKAYLEEARPALYCSLLLSGKLWTHLADVDEQAEERLALIMEQMKAAEGVTEELKARNQLAWVQHMNNIRSRAEEIIYVRSRNEFVTEALKFYCGYLNSGKAEDYLLQSLSSVLTSTVQDTENRLARMDFKIAVELSMLAHMIAYHSESRIDESAFRKLHAKCVEEVKRLNGAVELGDAYKYQKREN